MPTLMVRAQLETIVDAADWMAHPDAWAAFCEYVRDELFDMVLDGDPSPQASDHYTCDDWRWFLAGWEARGS